MLDRHLWIVLYCNVSTKQNGGNFMLLLNIDYILGKEIEVLGLVKGTAVKFQ